MNILTFGIEEQKRGVVSYFKSQSILDAMDSAWEIAKLDSKPDSPAYFKFI